MKYFLNRTAQVIPVLLIVSFILFFLVHISGDPVDIMLSENATEEDRETLRQSLGLDKPFIIQYFIFLTNMITGDFGKSIIYGQAALPIVLERIPATFELMLASIILSTTIAIPLGVLSAVKRNSPIDLLISGISILGKAMPNFWVGLMLILLFSVNLKIFPVSGTGSVFHLVLPAITIGSAMAAQMTRLLRSNMLDVLNQDYIRTAKSKGVKRSSIIYIHALRNSLLPIITVIALQISTLVGGALITETIFSWPGLGQLTIEAINARDMAVVQACVITIAVFVIIVNLIADLIYRFVDPRIRY
ncbi:ABC transporter permease [Alkalihalobacillus sp. TS-13]|uniref:ABC transporter permease n=1 Tax=Alkalihalobacillus sp. TS-13 TaxID=2842455 RepID=UPI001C886C6A|nr:ABC transporter permease [Alkalihalobacillus sp. TS-13]